jgi:S1-C subfamily serine protease
VVGVNSQIQSENGGNVGIGYAVPIDTAKRIAQQLIGSGKVVHAYLGVQLPASANAGAPGSARIESIVPGGAADKAGLQAGDRVVKADGRRVVSGSDLRAAVDARRPGETLTLQIVRDGKTKTVHVKLGRRPASVS